MKQLININTDAVGNTGLKPIKERQRCHVTGNNGKETWVATPLTMKSVILGGPPNNIHSLTDRSLLEDLSPTSNSTQSI